MTNVATLESWPDCIREVIHKSTMEVAALERWPDYTGQQCGRIGEVA